MQEGGGVERGRLGSERQLVNQLKLFGGQCGSDILLFLRYDTMMIPLITMPTCIMMSVCPTSDLPRSSYIRNDVYLHVDPYIITLITVPEPGFLGTSKLSHS